MVTDTKDPRFYLPYARSALRGMLTDVDLAIESGCDIRAVNFATDAIERCEYVIARMRVAIEKGSKS